MSNRSPLPPELRGVPFTVRQGIEAGAGPSRLRSGDLEQPFWGVRAPVGSRSTAALAQAILARRPDAVISHVTAALLWELPLPAPTTGLPVHLTVASPKRAPSGAGVRGHRSTISPVDQTVIHGTRITTLERTLCDIASSLTDEEFIAAGDNACWWRRPEEARATPESLTSAIARYSSRRGFARLTRLSGYLSPRADSAPESVFRWRFSVAGLPPTEPNLEIYSNSGRFLAMPDLQFAEYRIAFDYEGDHHRTDRRQWQRDIQRTTALQAADWHHVRGAALDLLDSRDLIDRLRQALRQRGWRG